MRAPYTAPKLNTVKVVCADKNHHCHGVINYYRVQRQSERMLCTVHRDLREKTGQDVRYVRWLGILVVRGEVES